MNKTATIIMAALITGIVFLIFFGKPNHHRSKDPIRNFSSESNAPDNRLEARSKHAILHTVGHTNRMSLTESTNSPPLQLVEEVGNQFPKYVEIKKILTGYDVCRTNPELAHRLTFETYADLGNAYNTATDAFSDSLSAPLPDRGASKKATNVNLDQSIKEIFSVRRVETLGALAGNGPMLISEESDSGLVTKTYQLTPSKSITEVVVPNPKVPLLGSVEYESLAKQDYFESIQVEPNLSELKEIFEDFPTAKQSEYLYSGIREAYAFKSKIKQLRDSDFLLSADQWKGPFEIEAISNPVERELKAQQINDRLDEDMNRILLDKADASERFKQRMVRLYGNFPKPIFQRLMSIDIFTEPKELIKP